MLTELEEQNRKSVAQANADALFEVLRQHPAIVLRADRIAKWRPTVLSTGVITGLEHLGELTVVATDGNVAWFLRPWSQPLLGHVQLFTGTVETLFAQRQPSAKTTTKQQILDTI